MVIVFDLDDTLYEEMTFVQSGFKVVASFLSDWLHIGSDCIYQDLLQELSLSRNQVFDRFLQKKGYFSSRLVKRCLSLYRGHTPQIHLSPEALDCLVRLYTQYPLYIVTDGNKLVQKRKADALGVKGFVKRCFFTYAHGLHRSKPSPYCFEKICRIEKVQPSQVIYVADNPYKDFVGIKPLGFHTIRVQTGPYKNVYTDPCHEAERTISSLAELDDQLIRQLEGNAR